MGAYLTDNELSALKKHLSAIVQRTRDLDPSSRKRVYNATRLTNLTLTKAERRAERLARKA